MAFVLNEDNNNVTNIKVIGVGGGGGNAVNRMVASGVKSVDFIVMNTDAQVLNTSKASTKIQLGAKLTKGRGAGANPDIGKKSAEETHDEICETLKGAQMCFITAGMGGGTGTGAAPVIASIAKDMGILTIGIVTRPFMFEGGKKQRMAEEGIQNLLQYVDSLIIVPNEKLKYFSSEKITLQNAFEIADNVLKQGVQNISELINTPSFINLDFADVRSVMLNQGHAHMGMGIANGKNKAEEAAKMAISSPLLETSIQGANGVIINIIAAPDIELEEIEKAAMLVTESANPDANIIWGCSFNEEMKDQISVNIIATGFNGGKAQNNSEPKVPEYVQSQQNISTKNPEYNNFSHSTYHKQPVSTSDFDKENAYDDVINLLNKR